MKHLLRQIPAIHELQQDRRFTQLLEGMSKQRATECLQEAVAEFRNQLINSQINEDPLNITDAIFTYFSERLSKHSLQQLQTVINGTGTVLHTNLGRARLSEKAVQNVRDVALNYSNLEYNLQKGKRGSRHDLIEGVLKTVSGAEAAMVVNNNAAAVYLVLKTLAKEREVIVSRGELVEIGGSFRVSSIMEESGAKLVEVGTTNKTHLKDYEEAITEQTAMIMKVHTSNFKMIGFTEEVPPHELKELSQEQNLIFFEDLGSGALYDFRQDGIGTEPTISEALKYADLVSFSGDKLLGGPQVGLIAGKKELIDLLKKDQLARVLRVDKMTLAALEATLIAYQDKTQVKEELPTIHAILQTKEEIYAKIEQFLPRLKDRYHYKIVSSTSQVGGGTMPEVKLDTYLLALTSDSHKSSLLHNRLRTGAPAVISRIQDDAIMFDFRTIEENEFELLAHRLLEVLH